MLCPGVSAFVLEAQEGRRYDLPSVISSSLAIVPAIVIDQLMQAARFLL